MTRKKTDSTAIKDSRHDAIFKIVKNKDEKFVIVVGNKIISKKEFESYSKADEYIGKKPWEIIVNLTYLILTEYEKEIQSTKSTKSSK